MPNVFWYTTEWYKDKLSRCVRDNFQLTGHAEKNNAIQRKAYSLVEYTWNLHSIRNIPTSFCLMYFYEKYLHRRLKWKMPETSFLHSSYTSQRHKYYFRFSATIKIMFSIKKYNAQYIKTQPPDKRLSFPLILAAFCLLVFTIGM